MSSVPTSQQPDSHETQAVQSPQTRNELESGGGEKGVNPIYLAGNKMGEGRGGEGGGGVGSGGEWEGERRIGDGVEVVSGRL